jgi:hypothetical protein
MDFAWVQRQGSIRGMAKGYHGAGEALIMAVEWAVLGEHFFGRSKK